MTPQEKQRLARISSFHHWRINPLSWVKDKFPTIKLSSQQVWFWEQLGILVRAKLKAWQVRQSDYQGDPLTDEEIEYAGKIGISISAGQGTGKDFVAAQFICWMLDCCPNSLVTATGVTGKHLRNVLWREISKIMRLAVSTNKDDARANTILEEVLAWQTEKIYHKGAKRPGAEWFAEAVTINPHAQLEEQAKTIYGRHEEWQAIVIDEAGGCPEPIFEPLEGTLGTGRVNIALMIFNCIKAKGYAYDSVFGKHKDKWITGIWNAEESELPSPEHLAKMLRYGRDSNTYRVKVRGLPPLVSDGGHIPYDKIMEAIDKEFELSGNDPVMGGVDCAGGGNKSVVALREGPMVQIHKKHTSDPDELEDWTAEILADNDADVAFIDNIGLGWYLPKKLQNRKINAKKGDFRSNARNPDKFFNRRTECYYLLSDAFIEGRISIPDDEDLINCLGAVKFETLANNRYKMPDKREMKREIKRNNKTDDSGGDFSPDESDAVALTFYGEDRLYYKGGKKSTNKIDLSKIFLR